ncbi:MAG: CRISPR-associated endoribonuclease Cas6 [Clostridia bacterium]|nr:CRISPR-associated endoribonuclease Cas6 [Clostridia bacterium]
MPQLHVTLSPEKPLILPIAHQHALQGMLLSTLSAGDPFMSRLIHDGKPMLHQRSYAPFVFSRLRGRRTLQDGQLTYTGDLALTIRSCSPSLLDTWEKGFRAAPAVTLLHQPLHITGTAREDYAPLRSTVRIRMQTPVVLHRTDGQGRTVFLSPFDSDFSAYISANFKRKWHALCSAPAPGSVSLTPVSVTQKHRCVTRFKGASLCGWYGDYLLRAPEAAVRFLLDTGMGERNGQGFGFFTIMDASDR